MPFRSWLDWFAGASDGSPTLIHRLGQAPSVMILTWALDLALAAGYLVLALRWWRNERWARSAPAGRALAEARTILLVGGLCGILLIPIKMAWPADRLADGLLAVLALVTWQSALRTRARDLVSDEPDRAARLMKDLEEAREESRRKGYFLNAISHDLKTPLNGLLLQAELARMSLDGHDEEELREALGQIRACARTTADLLNTFLELGRLDWAEDSIQAQTFDLGELVEKLAARARAQAALKGVRVATEVSEGLVLFSDPMKIERILFNFTDNALKFCQEGTIQLGTTVGPEEIVIFVEDTGVGIAPEHQRRIFDDFVQVRNGERDSRKGYGLGLGIARRLARKLGGTLTLASEPGRGSRFALVLPRSVIVGAIATEPEFGASTDAGPATDRPGIAARTAAPAPRGG